MSKRQDEIRLRKRINGWKPPVVGYEEDFVLAHHEPKEGLIVYKILTPKGCKLTGAPKWCTTSSAARATEYLQVGPLYVIHAQQHQSQMSVHPTTNQPYAWRDMDNATFDFWRVINICPSLMRLVDLIQLGCYYHQEWTKRKVIRNIKWMVSPYERLRFLKGVIDVPNGEIEDASLSDRGIRRGTQKIWSHQARDYRSAAAWLKPDDLIYFADDPSEMVREHVHRFLPSGATPDIDPNDTYSPDQLSFLLDEEVYKARA